MSHASPRVARYAFFFFFNDTATTEIYTLSLHDALPISIDRLGNHRLHLLVRQPVAGLISTDCSLPVRASRADRKSTRLNSSHGYISYAVFCLKKKKNQQATLVRRYV